MSSRTGCDVVLHAVQAVLEVQHQEVLVRDQPLELVSPLLGSWKSVAIVIFKLIEIN